MSGIIETEGTRKGSGSGNPEGRALVLEPVTQQWTPMDVPNSLKRKQVSINRLAGQVFSWT